MEGKNNKINNEEEKEEVIEVTPENPRQTPKEEPEKKEVISMVGQDIERRSDQRRPNIIIGTLNVFMAPAKALARPALEAAKDRYHRHYHPRHKHGFKHLIADLILAAIILFLIGVIVWAYWGGTSLISGVKLDVAVTPTSIKSGDQVTFTINYLNDNKARLDETKLSFKLPSHFAVKKAVPSASFDTKTNTFDIGHIEPGGNGQVKITGRVLGAINSKQKLVVYFNYLQEAKKLREQKIAAYKYNIESSNLRVDFNLPETLVNNQSFNLEIQYTNNSQNDFGYIKLIPDWPDEFKIISTEPKQEVGAWLIKLLGPQDRGVIKVKGLISGKGEAVQEFKIKSYLAVNEEELLQGEISKQTGLIYPKFSIGYKISGQDNININLGDILEYSILYENKEDFNVIDAVVSMEFDKDIFEADEYENGKIIWNKDNLDKLALIRPGKKGEIKFKVKVKPKIEPRKIFGDEPPVIRAQAKVSYRLEDDLSKVIPMAGPVLETKLNSDLAIRSFGRYYTLEGDQLGRGPLPPEVDLKTRYWAFLHILNSINDLEDVVITASLPDYVEWTGKSSVTLGDPLKFDPVTRQISWRVRKISKLTGEIYPDVGIALEIAITPSADQMGTSPVLIKEIKISAKDSFTGEFLESLGENITTDLKYDKRVKGKGRVIK